MTTKARMRVFRVVDAVVRSRPRWQRAGLIGLVTAVVFATVAADLPRRPAAPVAMPPAAQLPHHTSQQAFVAARQTGAPVEVTALRGPSREVYANPNGTLTQHIHQLPVRTVRNGAWVPTDATLVRRPDGAVAPRAAAVDLTLSGGGNGTLASIERSGRRYALSWRGPLPAPRLVGDTATYRQVLPDVDLVVRATVTGFTHVLVIRSPQAAQAIGQQGVSFGLATRLLRVEASTGGGLTMLDSATGEAVFETPAPKMWDSSTPDAAEAAGQVPDGARTAPLGIRLSADRLTLVPDTAMLTDPATRYPVYLDPFVAGTSNESWAVVDSGYPNEEYWKFDGDTNERVGYCPVGVSGQVCNSSRIKRLFYVLPTDFAGMTILKAKFRVTLQHTYDSTPRNVSLYRAGGGGALITSATNWNNMPGGKDLSGFVRQDTIAPTGTTGCESGATRNTEFDAGEAVRTAAANGWSRTTFLLKADNESSYLHLKRFCSNAVLSVTYNRAPYQPAQSALTMAPGGTCVSGTSRPYVSSLPKLKATLSDPDTADDEPLTAEYQVSWTPAGGSSVTRSWTSMQLANGSTFTYDLADTATGTPDLPENVVVQWRVRASDGTATGAWSATPCEFVFDKTKPTGPDIDSGEYLPADAVDTTPSCVESATWLPGVGRYGTFTFDSAATDVSSYQYGFDTNPSSANTLKPSTDGGPVSVRWFADTEGPHTINVVAVDRAGKQSDISSCTFRVAAGTGPVADWRLDDPVGSTSAVDAAGGHRAVAGAGVQFGVAGPGGAADRAVRLTGAADSYLATTDTGMVDTAKGTTISAWVRLTDLTKTQVVVSIGGSGGDPAVRLGYRADLGKWCATAAVTDVQTLGTWVLSGPMAVKDQWTHLNLTLDPAKQQMSLSVDGATPMVFARRYAWSGRGTVQIGRRFIRTGLYGEPFIGDVADVRLYDRILTRTESASLPRQLTTRLGYWDFDAMTPIDDQAPMIGRSPGYGPTVELEPALELQVFGGATHYRRLSPDEPGYDPFAPVPLVGEGHMVLDGVSGYATTAAAVVSTDGSFTVTGRVQLATACTTRPMTLLSQPGTHASGFDLGCAPDGTGGARWRVVLPGSDADAPSTTVVSADALRPDPAATGGQFLAVTYDAAYQTVRLYVDGQLVGSAGNVSARWSATAGGLQVGRALVGSQWGQYLAGTVDEVRAYTGVLDPVTIAQLASLTALPNL